MNREPDWSLWRSFSAVVKHGSLSAAARELGLSQPTLGRHIEALELALDLSLFERTLSGLKANEAALRLYEPVAAAETALAQAAILAQGAQAEFSGTVRITASAVVSNYILPTLLLPIRERYPAIAIETVPSDSPENLLLREADIAIRMFRPTQLELVTKKLGDIPIIACAHESYLARRGTPGQPVDLRSHDLIGFDRSDAILDHAESIGLSLRREQFVLRTDSQTQLWELVRAGLGIGFAQKFLVERTPGMVALGFDLAIPMLPVWLTTHKELFTSHRIRAIYDALAEGLIDYINTPTS
ncbi:MAG: LysR family transcriptional regulator [Devosia sp.]|uniref:LysR family transcriptional regulator n=1 Tax=Devosia sp. TaxID=1871048 RepID=UPI002620022F|nr:LysR family transcriptional regulator [Devosia sp.]MDB5586482.1 LysR family transcriptional regulator [Devosia sp.]